MTKRYLNVLTTGDIKDTVTGELIRGSGIGDLLNQLNDENEQLKQQLESEHQQLENAILLERTRMGKNALKQFQESLR